MTSSSNAFSFKANVLIDQNDPVRLADFELLSIVSDPTKYTASQFYGDTWDDAMDQPGALRSRPI